MIIEVFLKHSAPNFILDNFGQSMAQNWGRVLSLVYVLWSLLLAFILLMGSYLFIEERTLKKKKQLILNSEKEIVLSEHQKQNLFARGVFEITLIFNSQHRGLEPFSDDDSYLKFAVMGADGEAAESELEQYISKHLGKKVVIEAGKTDRTLRWDRIITLC